jgi:hypothetical protein
LTARCAAVLVVRAVTPISSSNCFLLRRATLAILRYCAAVVQVLPQDVEIVAVTERVLGQGWHGTLAKKKLRIL